MTFNERLNTFQTLLSTSDTSKALNHEQIIALKLRIETLFNDKTKLESLKYERNLNLSMITNLKRELSKLPQFLLLPS